MSKRSSVKVCFQRRPAAAAAALPAEAVGKHDAAETGAAHDRGSACS